MPDVLDEFFTDVSNAPRFREAIARFDALNAGDPNRETADGKEHPRELLNALRLSRWVVRLDPQASEELRLASRCQHLCRWMTPRDAFPMTRAGYHQWKNDAKQFHAARSAEVLRGVGYPNETIARVSDLNMKRLFPEDADTRVLEDALCLLFLEFQLGLLADKTDAEKVINALRKSWAKMTERARAEALKLSYGEREREFVRRALEPA